MNDRVALPAGTNWPGARTRLTLAAATLWLVAVLFLTLRPIGWIQFTPFWAFFSETMAGVDLIQNLVLFAPAGWVAQRAGWTMRRGVFAALLISACIEFIQLWVPGRTTTAMDITSNTAGAALGWWTAMPAVRVRARYAVAFGALAAFLWLHALNTTWPGHAEAVSGAALWRGVERHPCTDGTARELTVCLAVPNTEESGNRYLAITGANGLAFAKLQGFEDGRRMTRAECVEMRFEGTRSATLRLRVPLARACALADTSDGHVELVIDPGIERSTDGRWKRTSVGVWLWPVWPFTTYDPPLLRAVGAMAFVVSAALLAGAAPWMLPAEYLLILLAASLLTGMRAPGLWEIRWAAVAWLVATGAVRVDRWWRAQEPH